jgi:hypothetical protein
MRPFLKVRYVLISDYATVDHSGKFVIAGLYTEDLVVPSIPAVVSPIVLTVLLEGPERDLKLRFTVEAPSGSQIIVADGAIGRAIPTEGTRPRAVVGFQFSQVLFSEAGEYKVIVTNAENEKERLQIHEFNVVVNPQVTQSNRIEPRPAKA